MTPSSTQPSPIKASIHYQNMDAIKLLMTHGGDFKKCEKYSEHDFYGGYFILPDSGFFDYDIIESALKTEDLPLVECVLSYVDIDQAKIGQYVNSAAYYGFNIFKFMVNKYESIIDFNFVLMKMLSDNKVEALRYLVDNYKDRIADLSSIRYRFYIKRANLSLLKYLWDELMLLDETLIDYEIINNFIHSDNFDVIGYFINKNITFNNYHLKVIALRDYELFDAYVTKHHYSDSDIEALKKFALEDAYEYFEEYFREKF